MNNGLPSLLDAIFGKQDLASVSLDEMYELIKEFPSFNAAHFLLAKKLKQQDGKAFDKESMRTALYFNNPFWLQSLLDEENKINPAERTLEIREIVEEDGYRFEKYSTEPPAEINEEGNYTFEKYTVGPSAPAPDELDEETEEILDEKSASEPVGSEETFQYSEPGPDTVSSEETFQYSEPGPDTVSSEETFQYSEPGPDTVSSFDELMSKYKIEPLDLVDETPVEIPEEPEYASAPEAEIKVIHESHPDLLVVPGTDSPSALPDRQSPDLQSNEDFSSKANEINRESATDSMADQFEIREEVVNEYGVFEEVLAKKTDHDYDMDAFDRPIDQIPFVPEKISEEVPEKVLEEIPEKVSEEVPEKVSEEIPEKVSEEIVPAENSSIVENQIQEDSPDKTDEYDYDSFDPPVESAEPEIPAETMTDNEVPADSWMNEADSTGMHSAESDHGNNDQMQKLSDRFDEQQKSLAAFNAKNAGSIVFTPYHMVDYFASQGIKLVLEDNPPDTFSKQLKSFTDWLKVMKKLPVQPSSEKTDEKEAERIRHFAAHSIEERDILTESMAEVLAKQGMYENAIALYQKLSLIYPPKSAYFASRIEQLKASLP